MALLRTSPGHFIARAARYQTLSSKIFPFTMTISRDLLAKQNAETSNALIEHCKGSSLFASLSKYEGDLTIQRDKEDGVKLEKGIDFAKAKGVIDPDYVPEPYIKIDVLGKTPDVVAEEILQIIKANKGQDDKGSVVVLCGLSGTGKVSKDFDEA